MLCRHESCGKSGRDVPNGETMTRVQSILTGATALALAFAGATAFIVERSAVNASTIYEVDEDGDGRADRWLILEQSDSLA
jgi:hypothetical protein